MDDGRRHAAGTFAALRRRMFAVLLSLQLVNAVAVWSHVVTVQWTLTERGESAIVISLAPAAMALPFLLLALPTGAVVGFASRERLLAVGTGASATSAMVAALVTVMEVDRAALLIATVLVVGAALVVVGVAWQSLLPELVDRPLLPSATVLDGAIYNVARAIGPLLAGIGLGALGPTWTFLVTGLMFGACSVVLTVLEVRRPGRRRPRRPVLREVVEGLWFTRHSPWTRRLLHRLVMFGFPASALWALVSLVVHDRLGLGSQGFGVVMALIGTGAVTATFALPPLRRRLSVTAFAAWGSAVYALTLLVMGLGGRAVLVGGVLVLGGIAWVGVQSTWMMLAHQALPEWVRPRVIALLLFLFQGTQAIGSLLWGVVADLVGLPGALLAAAVLMTASVLLLLRGGLGSSVGIEPDLSVADPAVRQRLDGAGGGAGGLVVRYEYEVPAERGVEFAEAMERLRLSRLRLGARRWCLERLAEQTDVFVETYLVASRRELLEQETVRLTVPEQRLRSAARALAVRVDGPHTSAAPRGVGKIPRRGPGRSLEGDGT